MESIKKTVVRFFYEPIESEGTGADVYVLMNMPVDAAEFRDKKGEIEDCIASYIDAVPAWSFEGLALDVAKSFDPDAEIVELTTFTI